MQKKVIMLFFLAGLMLMLSLVSAEKLNVAPIKETFVAGENINLKVSLLDSNNNPINTNVDITLEDAEKKMVIKRTVSTDSLVEVNLGDNAPAGYWKVTAAYGNLTSSALFMVELNELVKFEIKDNILIVINIGNIPYKKTIQIVIGETIGSKEIDLGVGESTTFRLIAPLGNYNVKVTDGKTTLATSNVALTGNVVGVLDNQELSNSPLTSGIKGADPAYGEDNTKSRSGTLAYIFLFVILTAAILVMIERRMKKSAYN